MCDAKHINENCIVRPKRYTPVIERVATQLGCSTQEIIVSKLSLWLRLNLTLYRLCIQFGRAMSKELKSECGKDSHNFLTRLFHFMVFYVCILSYFSYCWQSSIALCQILDVFMGTSGQCISNSSFTALSVDTSSRGSRTF